MAFAENNESGTRELLLDKPIIQIKRAKLNLRLGLYRFDYKNYDCTHEWILNLGLIRIVKIKAGINLKFLNSII